MRVLVVEDSEEYAQLVVGALRTEGFAVDHAADGVTALELARANEPEIVILDLVLPGIGGIEVCRELRTFSKAHLVMLTSKNEEFDKVVGLSVGADDYVTKPFSVRELVARVRSASRRISDGPPAANAVRRFGPLELDTDARSVKVRGVTADLTKIEFDLLEALLSRPRMVWSRAALIERVWGSEGPQSELVVDTHVKNLRRKIDLPDEASLVLTVRGVGYRLAA